MLRSHSKPCLSVVVTSRNDDHGGNLFYRMQLFVDGLLEQCRRHELDAELIVVEWNPPPNKPSLGQALAWPVENGSCDVRIIEVSPEIHKRFGYWDRLPLFQMIAKNVGIRRARGPFVLATNIDILFSNELISFLASKRLRPSRMYRIDRYDVRSQVPIGASINEQLAYCQHNLLRVNERDGTKDFVTGNYHMIHAPKSRSARLREKLSELAGSGPSEGKRLHTNAAGDFTLLSRENWFALRGYPEFQMYCMHTDALLCQSAYYSGVRERVLEDPMRIYHIEHGTGSGDGAGAAGDRVRKEDLEATAGFSAEEPIPSIKEAQFHQWVNQMRREGRPIIFNDENWGLASEDLPEQVICAA